jgi:hypothetical protein
MDVEVRILSPAFDTGESCEALAKQDGGSNPLTRIYQGLAARCCESFFVWFGCSQPQIFNSVEIYAHFGYDKSVGDALERLE